MEAQREMTEQLTVCISCAEKALTEDNLDELEDAVEKEKEITFGFAKQEKQRLNCVSSLSSLLEVPQSDVSLRKLAGKMEDRELADRLMSAGAALSASAQNAQQKNQQVHGVLMLKNEYTDTMLHLLAGNTEDTSNHSYDLHGEKVKSSEPDHGIFEVLI